MVRKKQIIIPIAILIIGIASYFGFASLKKPPEQKADVDNRPIVAVDKISLLPLTLEVDSYGVVKPKYETTVVAQVSGEIVEISEIFVKGGFIKKNQLLARIDPNDYRAALIDAESNMASAKASLETEQAQGKVAEKEWKQITDASPTELSLRKPQLAQELARVKSAQASILRAKRNLQRTEIRAPYDAIINKRSIGLGSFVGVGTEIGKLSGTGIAEVRLPVADNQLQFLINQGQQANVSLTGSYAGKNSQWVANIIRSEGVIDDSSRMSYLVAEIEDPYNFEKYAPESNKVTVTWSWIQFMFTFFLLCVLYASVGTLPLIQLIGFGAFIFLGIYAYTEFMDRNPYSIGWEIARNLIGIVLLFQTDWFGLVNKMPWLFGVLIVYFVIASIVTFIFVRSFAKDADKSPMAFG